MNTLLTNWWCRRCGWRWYVRPDKQKIALYTTCPACGSEETERDV